MRNLCFILFLLTTFACDASARVQFPAYESLLREEQEAWGYKLDKSVTADGYAFFELTIPPKTAKLFITAKLEIYDKQQQLQFTVDLGLLTGADGSLSIRIERMHDSGDTTLIVSTKELPGMVFRYPFGGFTFHIPPESPHP